MKKCSKCCEQKDFIFFHKNKKMKDGHDHYCKECRNAKSSNWKSKNIEKITEYNKNYYKDNSESQKAKAVRWSLQNSVKYKESNRKACIKWASLNNSHILEKAARRRASKLNATPPWLTKQDFEQIKELYEIAKAFKLYTGEEYHVDHIIPLQGENVCGLHVPWNLQVISAKENLSKHNKLIQE